MPEPTDVATVLALTSVADRPAAHAIDLIGAWVDAAWDQKRADVLEHVIGLAGSIERNGAGAVQRTLLDYYLANAWNGLKVLRATEPAEIWQWEQREVENEFLCVRRALRSSGFGQLPIVRQCQILTNLGNCCSTTGRFLEAIESWDRALVIEPRFGMARGNRAVGLWTYARSVYDDGHALVLARAAWNDLAPSGLLGLEPGAGMYFTRTREAIEAAIPSDALKHSIEMDAFPIGDTEAERGYRRWCLAERLFLNPLNDIGPFAIAGRDILTAPSIVAPIGESPRFHGFFNQVKQELCSARWLAYNARHDVEEVHFADRGVLLYNTLDYPSYSMATEQGKLAFRALYSLFDKIAFFLNAYLALGIPDNRVTFRSIWYADQQKKKGIRPEFERRENWPLRGLYWLGKDLFEDRDEFRAAIDPDAQRLNEIRNHLEHKYLKLHDAMWIGTDESGMFGFTDDLALSVYRTDFEAMTLRLLKLARAALIYLSLGVHREERMRAAARSQDAITPPMVLDVWEDDWKR